MTDISNKDIMCLMNDAHNNFFKKYRDIVEFSDEVWENIISDVNAIALKYQDFSWEKDGKTKYPANELLLWFVELLERRSKVYEQGGEEKNK